MTDEDVVRKAATVAGAGSVRIELRKPPRQTIFVWHVGRIEDVRRIMRAILPHMGERRTKRIRELLDAAESINGYRKYRYLEQVS